MRNLKRALSLTLASVMLLGMMVVGSSAAAGYDDVKETDNVEAIEVLQAVEVMVGDDRGFGPDRPVSRAEMAVVMGKLLNLDYNYYVSTCPFTDVSGNYDWARGWVGACAANGIVSGRGNGVYDPAATVTAVEAASMMMRALGYFQYTEDYAGGFVTATVRQGSEIGIFNGVGTDGTTPMTRNQVAQMALNALRSEVVTFTGTPGIEANGVKVGYRAEYTPRTSTESKYNAIEGRTSDVATEANHKGQYYIQLGEQLYDGKLKLDNDDLDVFGRPSRKWEYDGKEIGTYMKGELMKQEYVGKVTGNDLYTLLGAGTIKDYDVLVTIDGVANNRSDAKDILKDAYFDDADMNRNNKKEVGATGTGVLTQVFVDDEKDEAYVAVINTYLARASRDYDDKGEEATLTVYGIDEYRTSDEYVKDPNKKEHETMKIQNEDFNGFAADIKKDDSFLVQVADGEIQTIRDAEVLEAVTLTAFKLTDHVVSGGTEYKYTTTATYKDGDLDVYTGNGATNLKDITYNIYLDVYGNLIGIEEVDAAKNYVFLAGIDVDGSNLYSKTATANALFLDGTSKTIKINLSKSEWTTHPGLNNTNVVISGDALLNTWCTYTVSGDMYTVKEVYATKVNKDHPAYGTDNIVADADNYPQHGKNTTKLAQSWQETTEKDWKVDVKRMRLRGGAPSNTAYANVYGDSTSVYLTAELDELFNDAKGGANVDHSYGIIKGVDSVTTGVADASITVWTREEAQNEADRAGKISSQNVGATSHGIYTLYDSDGIVIAAVVVGEDEGVKDMVYVHTDKLDLESYNSTDDIWTWTRKVIFNGEEITLTEKGDAVSDLENMKQYQWYEIKRNNNGEIIDADPAYNALDSYRLVAGTARNDKGYFVDLYEDINNRVEDSSKDTVLYQTDGGPYNYTTDPACHSHVGLDKPLSVIGSNTLAVETLTGSGIHFRNDVNVVLQYYNQNTKQVEIETGTGVDDLKSMVDFVNDNNATGRMINGVKYNYFLSALIEKGFATTIVIYDSYNNYRRPDVTLGTYELTLGGVLNSIYSTSEYSNSDVYIVNADRSIDYVESNDDVATSTVNGYKRYTVPYGATIRVYDNDVRDADFLPFFSPIKALSDYNYRINTDARRAYIEFTVDERLDNDRLTLRERLSTDGIYVGVAKDAKVNVTIDGVKYDAAKKFIAYDGSEIKAVPNAADAKVYLTANNRTIELTAPNYTYIVTGNEGDIIISTTGGSTPVETYTVTAATAENGTVTVDKTIAKAGDTVTVTATPADGYELDTLTVKDAKGNTITVTGGKFTMPAANVTVTATFKEKIPEGTVKVTSSWTGTNNDEGTYKLMDTTGKTVTEVKPGDTIVINYYAALILTGDVTKVADVTIDGKSVPAWKVNDDAKSIIVTNNTGWNWRFGTWLDPTWNEVPPLAGISTMSFLRAAVSGPRFLNDVRENGTKYWIDITMEDGSKFVVVVSRNAAGGVSFQPYDGVSFDKMDAAMARTGISSAYTVYDNEEDVKPEDPDERTGSIEADVKVVRGSNNKKFTATFTEYLGDSKTDPDKLKAAEVVEILNNNAVCKEYGLKFTADKVDLATGTGKAEAENGAVVNFTASTPTRVWKITYPGGVKYTAATVTVDDVTDGVTALLPKDTRAGSASVGFDVTADEDKGTNTATSLKLVKKNNVNVDTEYVAAVESTVGDSISNWDSGNTVNALKAELDMDGADDGEGVRTPVSNTNHKYIQVGTKIYLTKHASQTGLAAGRQISLIVNGDEDNKIAFIVNEEGDIEEQTITVTKGCADGANKNKLTLKAILENASVVVKLDGEVQPVDEDGNVRLTIPTGMTLVYKNAKGEYTNDSLSLGTAGSNNTYKVAVTTGLASALDSKTDEYLLYLAYSVAPGSQNVWEAYTKLNAFETDVSESESPFTATKYFLPGEYIYVKAKSAHAILGTFDEDGNAVRIDDMSDVETIKAVDTAKLEDNKNVGVWAVPVTEDIVAGDFKELVVFAKTSLKATVKSALTAGKDKGCTGGGITLGKGVEVSATFTQATEEENEKMKDVTILGSVALDNTGKALVYTITADKDVAIATAEEYIGTFDVTLSDGTNFQVDVVMTPAS